MSILLGIAAAIIGGLFWNSRRRAYYYGPVIIINNDADVYSDGAYDDACDDPSGAVLHVRRRSG
jgi:hypothetical protein